MKLLQKRLLLLLVSLITGLGVLLAVLGADIFVASLGPNFHSEVGVQGTFLIFGLLFAASYICIFIITIGPLYLLLPVERFPGWAWAFVGTLIFGCGIPILNRFFSGPTDPRSSISEAALGCVVGLTASCVLFVLSRRSSLWQTHV
jgi:uncharacterized BrkB/YihY/UPF0761 family membrane protein